MDELWQPLERLNYYNGQRLEAADFKLEQDYHMRVRRWLNKSLYTWGIAAGLEVTVKKGDKHTVVVAPGLALDEAGQEILLLEETEIQVIGIPSPTEGVVTGNYLVIQYAEYTTSKVEDGCKVRPGGTATRVQGQAAGGCCGSHNGHGDHNGHGKGTHDQASRDLLWGGPGRIRTVPQLSWQDTWPQESTGKIVLAQVELDAGCAVRRIHTGVRKYVGVAEGSKVQSFALEGEKDIDKDNPKQLHFHVRGGRPGSVALYLRAAKFSTLYYTEMGQHAHGLNIELEPAPGIPAHSHTLGEIKLTGGAHPHGVTADVWDNYEAGAFDIDPDIDESEADLVAKVNLKVTGGDHEHVLGAGQKTDEAGAVPGHNHKVNASVASTGLTPAARTSGVARTYVADLKVWIDNQEYTAAILGQLGWTSLGDGSDTHALVTQGTGPIQLDLLGADLSPGDHLIEFKVGAGGGRVLYNLYVE